MPGVHRRPLDRVGDEVARATSIVRYEPGSAFSPHTHTGGEEFLVLEGVFQDEHGDYPVGTYVRNPPTSAHTPAAKDGCVIFVKLWQFDPDDRKFVSTHIDHIGRWPTRPGVDTTPLYSDSREQVGIEQWLANTTAPLFAEHGLEAFVIDGSFRLNNEHFERWSWLRLPVGDAAEVEVGPEGARVWVKRNHLRFAEEEAVRVLGA